MRYLIVLISSLYLINECLCVESNRDSLELKVSHDSISGFINNEEIYCSISNNYSDTLLIINEFYIEGLLGETIAYPMPTFNNPNILIVTSEKFHQLEGDGHFTVNYYKFPSILIIPPKSIKVIKIYISQYQEFFSSFNWGLGVYLRLAYKKELDLIVNKYYDYRKKEYENSLTNMDTVDVHANLIDSLDYIHKPENKDELLNLIQDVFKIIL